MSVNQKKRINRITVIVLDSVGCGDAPDAQVFGDEGSNTLRNISLAVGGLNLPNLEKLGLGNTTSILGVSKSRTTSGGFGRLTEFSAGKDTTTGHWELCGVILDHPFPVYPNGFPKELMSEFEAKINMKTIGNYPASGTEIIKQLGREHIETGMPIIYTSADSVFQIAAHEGVIPLPKLYEICEVARELLTGDHEVGRVIARPFIGDSGNFTRTEHRRDFSLPPPSETVLDAIVAANLDVIGIGKIEDIFANRGLTQSYHTGNNTAGLEAIIDCLDQSTKGLIFANLVDFDALYGHRNNPRGYADALEAFDRRVPAIIGKLNSDDLLIITADHGNDPTTPGTDHSRERVPFLAVGQMVKPNSNIGTNMFVDLAGTIADLLRISWNGPGNSFSSSLLM